MRAIRTILLSLTLLLASAAPAFAAEAAGDSGWRDVRLRVHTTDAAGTSIAWSEIGTGPALLLLNGTGSPMNEWDPALLAGLAVSRRVIVFDYPGLGQSGPAPGRWRFDSAADWTAALLRRVLPGASVDVLGWSMGGFIAQRLAVRHPQLVRRLVLAATNPGGDDAVLGPPWVQQADSDPAGDDAAYLATNYPRTSVAQSAGRSFLRRLASALETGAYPSGPVPSSTYDAMVAAEDPWLRSNANRDSLHGLSIPTLVITGARDVITPPVNSRRMAALIPGARLSLVPGAGHSFLFQRPRHVARLVLGFLDTVPIPKQRGCRIRPSAELSAEREQDREMLTMRVGSGCSVRGLG